MSSAGGKQRNGRVGVVLVTHGDSGAALLRAVAEVVGDSAASTLGWLVVDHLHTEPKGALASRVTAAAAQVEAGTGVLYVCDLFGSTPGNVCVDAAAVDSAAGRPSDVLFGINLAMLVKLASLDRNLLSSDELAQGACETARRTVRAVLHGHEQDAAAAETEAGQPGGVRTR